MNSPFLSGFALADPDTEEQFSETAIETLAGFVGDSYPAFFLQFRPARTPRAHLVYLPPFAEEMNRCRSLVATQARWFAGQGLCCSILDFYGTGESRGDMSDATLQIWRQNIDDLVAQIMRRDPGPVYLWGCRLGALLALDYVAYKPGFVRKLLLWQPVVSGSAFVTRMLRQRTAALIQKGEQAESTAEMKMRLAAGDSFEVAGYSLGGELTSALDQLEMGSILNDDPFAEELRIFWLEHTQGDGDSPGAKASRVLAELERTGAWIEMETFTGDPVWQLHKRGVCEELLVKTRKLSL